MDFKEILTLILKWGLGGLMCICGIGVMIGHKQLDIETVPSIIIGVILLVFGCLVYLTHLILDYKKGKEKDGK